ncbi:LOW QUALITY PROTEIN: pumilio homolog 24 [Primulina tabacum]|uniref:LOW QUALITY PROTEIN: pumilio homolog 24 n=1 Tax=Primulina tabacum TaxID=48773 RepID=UPI003F5993E4
MAPKPQKVSDSKKRKSNPNTKSVSKKPKFDSINIQTKVAKKPSVLTKHKHQRKEGRTGVKNDDVTDSKKQRRLDAKELAEARKKKRKKHYSLEQELAVLWEKMRRRNIAKEDRSMLVSEALKKMKGKISEIASSHVSSRVLQTCVKHCTQEERTSVFAELRPCLVSLATNTYAVHLVTKMLDNATKEQLAEIISALHGHVAALLRHMVGSLVIEHAYELGNTTQKQALLSELYSPELQLFKNLVTMKETRLVDVISKLQLQKPSVLRHMASVLQPILEKGILDHSIVHKTLMEFLSVADKSSAADIIQQLSALDLVRMFHTKDGSRLGILCIKHGSAKERKKIIKGLKGHIDKIARDKFGSMVLVSIFSIVDDTKLVSKMIIRELEGNLKELISHQDGRRLLLQLLHPNSTQYFSPDDITSLSLSIPSLSNKDELQGSEAVVDDWNNEDASIPLSEGGKKDPFKRRQELLVDSGLAEKLVDACHEMVGELLRSKSGKDVIYEVSTGGADGILYPNLSEKLGLLHESIASVAAQPKQDEPEEEHLLENFHSSRTIRKLVLNCPAFATVLWEKALKGKCGIWAEGHSSKVIKAYLETSETTVKEIVTEELQPFIENGVLSIPFN